MTNANDNELMKNMVHIWLHSPTLFFKVHAYTWNKVIMHASSSWLSLFHLQPGKEAILVKEKKTQPGNQLQK